jgi:hypothetical protein
MTDKVARKRAVRRPVQTQASDTLLQQKLDKLIELQKGITILKDRMSTSKNELIRYFEQNPTLKQNKYMIDDYAIRYVDKKTTDGISQKLIISGLSAYFKAKGISDVGVEVTRALNIIKDQRNTKIVPHIDVSSKRSVSTDSD